AVDLVHGRVMRPVFHVVEVAELAYHDPGKRRPRSEGAVQELAARSRIEWLVDAGLTATARGQRIRVGLGHLATREHASEEGALLRHAHGLAVRYTGDAVHLDRLRLAMREPRAAHGQDRCGAAVHHGPVH